MQIPLHTDFLCTFAFSKFSFVPGTAFRNPSHGLIHTLLTILFHFHACSFLSIFHIVARVIQIRSPHFPTSSSSELSAVLGITPRPFHKASVVLRGLLTLAFSASALASLLAPRWPLLHQNGFFFCTDCITCFQPSVLYAGCSFSLGQSPQS